MITTTGQRNIAHARGTLRGAFKCEPEFKKSYIANVAMLLHDARDKNGRIKVGDLDAVAEEVIDLIVGVDP